MRRRIVLSAVFAVVATAGAFLGFGSVVSRAEDPAPSGTLTIYSGRGESLVGALIERYREQTGVDVKMRYGKTAALAQTLMAEGSASPADIFFAQDGGALGALAKKELTSKLPASILDRVPEGWRAPEGTWVGTSGRARAIVYNTKKVKPEDLPDSILGFADPKWKGRLGWAPGNGSFQAHVSAMRHVLGEAKTRAWLEAMIANEPRVYPKNSPIVEAAGAGEVDVGLVNHYYLHRFLKAHGEGFGARNYFFPGADIGNVVNVAGVAVLATSKNVTTAQHFVGWLLDEPQQRYFAEKTYEFPAVRGVALAKGVTPMKGIEFADVKQEFLVDLEGTLKLLRDTGAL